MTTNFRTVFVVSLLLGAGAFTYFFQLQGNHMIKLDINFVATDDLRKSGGLVVVLPDKLSETEFKKKHGAFFEDGNRIKKNGSDDLYRLSVSLKNTVSFVHIDTPGTSYVYRLVPDGKGSATTLEQKQIGIGSGGAVYMDKATDDPVEAGGSMDHYIKGSKISLGDALGLESMTLDMWVDASACRVKGPVRVCHARDSDVSRLTSKFSENKKQD